ncbi:ExeA family protein [Thermodesulfovibrio hydrogeniphilus]
MEHLEFFNLKKDPFSINPEPALFYPTEIHQEVIDTVKYMLSSSESMMLVTGQPGIGKTLLVKKILEHLLEKEANVHPILIFNPAISPTELLDVIMKDLKIDKPLSTKVEIYEYIKQTLCENQENKLATLLIIDEAQDLPEDTLNEIKHLSNLEENGEKLLKILMLAQPFFLNILKTEKNSQINQRITLRVNLQPLTKDEMRDFIYFKLRKAGNSSINFEKGALKLIYKKSKGIPRVANLICSRALMVAYLKNSQTIKKSFVKDALKNINL